MIKEALPLIRISFGQNFAQSALCYGTDANGYTASLNRLA